MPMSDLDREKVRQEQELRIQRQIAFASGLFQGDVTVRTLLESLAEGCVIIDDSGTILLVNTRAEQMFGYPRKDLIGKPHAVLIPELFRKVHEGHEAHFFAEPRIRPMGQLLDLAGRRRDGSEFPVEISLSSVETINGVLALAFVSDITVRKQAEETVRESEQRFASFMLHLPAAAWMKDLHGRYVYTNAEAERVFPTPLPSLLGKTDGEVFPPETARQFVANDRRVLTEGSSLRTTEVLRQSDGIEHHSIVSKFAIPGPDGRPECVAGVAFDITELKQAEEALQESEEKFSKIFDTTPVGITISSLADGRFVEINREGERLSGYRRDEVIGRTALEFNIWKDAAERARMIEDVRKEGAVRDREMTFRDKEGNALRGLFSAVIIDIGRKKHLLSLVSDITERKRAEEALRFSEARYRALHHDNPTMIFTLDTGWTILSVNPFGASQLGYTTGELEGQSVLKVFHEDDRLPLTEQLRRCLQSPDQVHRWQFRKIRKDGSLLWVEESAQAVHDLNGALNILVVCQDVTERKRMEEEIERLNTDLAARAVELEAANRELEAFNYTVAHDLRKPLAVVNGYCQTIRELCGDMLDERCKEYLQETYDGTWRMNRLIDTLLNFSRMAHVELRRETVDLCKLAQEVAAELRHVEPERRVTLRIAAGVFVDGDTNLLRVVLDNLLGNAWKYTGMRKEAIIEFGAMEIDGQQACFVRDNGTGFDMADADKLFTPFRRLPGVEASSGFGVGLATVERIILRHGGRIWAEGEPGKGATFYFTLPAGMGRGA